MDLVQHKIFFLFVENRDDIRVLDEKEKLEKLGYSVFMFPKGTDVVYL